MKIIYYHKIDSLDITDLSVKDNIVISISSNFISSHKLNLSNLNTYQVKKSIGFNLESDLLDDVNVLDFFVKKDNNKFSVIVIAKQVLINLKKLIKKNNLNITGAYADFMFIPYVKNKISYKEHDNNIIFRNGKYNGGRLCKNLFFIKFKDSTLNLNKTIANDYNTINLLQINFFENLTKYFAKWYLPFIIFTGAFLINIALIIMNNNNLAKNINELHIENKALFYKIFPSTTKIVDIKLQSIMKLKQINQQQALNNDLLKALAKKNINKKITTIIFDKTLKIK